MTKKANIQSKEEYTVILAIHNINSLSVVFTLERTNTIKEEYTVILAIHNIHSLSVVLSREGI